MRYLLCIIFLNPLFAGKEDVLRQIEAKKSVHELSSAFQDIELLLKEAPEDDDFLRLRLRLLARLNSEKALIQAFKEYEQSAKNPLQDRELLEAIAWGIINEGTQSRSPEIRFYAILGAHQSLEAQGVKRLIQGMKDPHALIRAISCQLSGSVRDECVKEQVFHLFSQDSDWRVHLEAIRALGRMKCQAAKAPLISLVSNGKLSAEERAVALEALVTLTDSLSESELKLLVSSDRLAFRLLGCQMLEYFDEETDVKVLFPLLKDPLADVRSAAAHALGVRHKSLTLEESLLLHPLLKDKDSHVVINAAWSLTLFGDSRGLDVLVETLSHPKKNVRILAAAALASTGVKGEKVLVEAFHKTTEFFPKLNLCLGVMKSQKHLDQVSAFLYDAVVQTEQNLMKKEESQFKVFTENSVKHDPLYPQKPELIDQKTRFQLLNDLSLLDPKRSLEAARVFLKQNKGSFTAEASALFLTEGDDAALDIVQKLLDDPDGDVKLEAALVLAAFARDPKILTVLQSSYAQANREVKERILQAVGQLGLEEGIPFLVKSFFEPYQTLRLVGAGALLHCLSS